MTRQFVGYRDAIQVGEGGLGSVYRAVRESTGSVVALKELREVGVGSPVWHRARRELDAMLRLRGHPHVVYVEEIIEGPLGPCLVMEFAPGGSLMDRLTAAGSLTAPELVLVGQHVSQALVAAHRLGIVHRDVKPHNLLVGAFGQVKVCDFGIAALTRGAGGRTQTQAITLAYASPEELDGADEVGPPADVYSFGATLLHLATGHRPSFRERMGAASGEQLQAVDDDRVLGEVLTAVRGCLFHDPVSRPTMIDLVAVFDRAAAALGPRRLAQLAADDLEVTVEHDGGDAAVELGHPTGSPVLVDEPTTLGGQDDAVGSDDPQSGATVIRADNNSTVMRTATPAAAPDSDSSPANTDAPHVPVRRRALIAGVVAAVAFVVAAAAFLVITNSGDDNRLTSSCGTEQRVPCRVTTLTGHTSIVTSVAYSADGSRIVTGSDDGTAIVWNAASGNQLTTLTGHTDSVDSVAYSPNGSRIVTGSRDGTAIVRDAASGNELFTIFGHTDPVTSVVYSANGSSIVGINGGTAIVWDATIGNQLTELHPSSTSLGIVTSVAISPDGNRIVTGTHGGSVILWAGSGNQLTTLTGHTDSVDSVAYSPDGSRIVTGCDDGTAIVWWAATGNQLTALTGHADGVTSVAFSPDGSRIVTGSDDGRAIVWDAATGDRLTALTGHVDGVTSVAFSPDGSRIVTGGDDGTAIVWDVSAL